jgi:transposase, IS5 family
MQSICYFYRKKLAFMFNYTSQKQLEIFDFKTEFESKLDPNNRWVKMAKLLDWDKLAEIYGQNFSSTMGATSVDARVVVGALIIKHIEGKDDRGTIDAIKENPYMQFFLGFDHFSFDSVFDASLFVHIRKRLGNEDFDKMNQIIIAKALNINHKEEISLDKKEENKQENNQEPPPNEGKLQLDATIADAHIKYPTDLSLLNDSREKSEQIIDEICEKLAITKPRTYRREARKSWLNLSKSKKKSYKQIQIGIKQQLNYLKRNLKSIDALVDKNPLALGLLDNRLYRDYLVIQELYRQQLEMYKENKRTIENRIVSIHQPHIRPMVRGKQGKSVEFGAKINVSLQQGYARIDQIDFEAFNEGNYLIEQVENYKKLNGYYPKLVQTDQIYMTRENRKYLKDNNIRHTGKPLGRQPKEELNRYQKDKLKRERGERNHIEGKFGQGKAKYNLNKIMAKLQNTSQSWIASILFVMNILKLTKEYSFAFFWHLISLVLYQNYSQKRKLIPLFLEN